MDDLGLRFQKEGGGLYLKFNEKKEQQFQSGGAPDGCSSPTSENWKKKFLEVQSENDNLKTKITKLEKKLKKLESK